MVGSSPGLAAGTGRASLWHAVSTVHWESDRLRIAAEAGGSRSIGRWQSVAVRTGRSRVCRWEIWCLGVGNRRRRQAGGRRRGESRRRAVAGAVGARRGEGRSSRVAAQEACRRGAGVRRSNRYLTSLLEFH